MVHESGGQIPNESIRERERNDAGGFAGATRRGRGSGAIRRPLCEKRKKKKEKEKKKEEKRRKEREEIGPAGALKPPREGGLLYLRALKADSQPD